jgi:hypothetical protein
MGNCCAKGHANSLLLACSEPRHISRNEHPELTRHKPKKVCGVGCLARLTSIKVPLRGRIMLETPIIVVLVLLAIVAVLWWVYR